MWCCFSFSPSCSSTQLSLNQWKDLQLIKPGNSLTIHLPGRQGTHLLILVFCKNIDYSAYRRVAVQLLSHVWLFVTPWTAAHQASLSFTDSLSLLRFMSIESVMLSNHLILCCPLLLLPSIFPSLRVFSSGSSYQVAKVLEFQLQHHSFQWIFRVDFR